ncbi:hypothetical protein NI25_22560 [Streptomyces sp. CCM_MD2014]|nr:hypothetical protein NI25_22560 [Streptomyces sp. CCM_MD2014]
MTGTGGHGMTGDLRFSWEPAGSGWARYRVADATSDRADIVSHCTDALSDLLRAVASLYGTANAPPAVTAACVLV